MPTGMGWTIPSDLAVSQGEALLSPAIDCFFSFQQLINLYSLLYNFRVRLANLRI